MRSLKILGVVLAFVALFLAGCSEKKGPVSVQVMQPIVGQHCGYQLAPYEMRTMQDLSQMSGALGKVVYSGKNLFENKDLLDTGTGFSSVDVQFGKSGNTYFPLDYSSLFSASLYYAVDLGYRVTSALDPAADFVVTQPDFAARTLIVHEAKYVTNKDGKQESSEDNASYVAYKVTNPDGTVTLRNYIFSYPTDKIKNLPLGLNVGIMVHEYAHLVMSNLAKKQISDQNVTLTEAGVRVFRSWDEGVSDYMGFLATGDPGYFLCSYPEENRDLSNQPLRFSDTGFLRRLGDNSFNYDEHEGGAIWAAANYEIGKAIGFERNGQLILQMEKSIVECGGGARGGTLNLDFAQLARCHASKAGARSGDITAIYRSWGLAL